MLAAQGATARAVRCEVTRDLKLEADYALHQFICEALGKRSGFPVISEESPTDHWKQVNHGYVWIVDPLDGSLNFARGIPFASISIALWRGMTPLVGVVYDVHRQELFSGVVGTGAWLNGAAIHVSGVQRTHDAVLCTGFPVRMDYATSAIQEFITRVQTYKKVRLLGSAALSLAYVACGRADVYQEDRIALWDVAAGLALVQAAGGIIHVHRTQDPQLVLVQAGNRHVLAQED